MEPTKTLEQYLREQISRGVSTHKIDVGVNADALILNFRTVDLDAAISFHLTGNELWSFDTPTEGLEQQAETIEQPEEEKTETPTTGESPETQTPNLEENSQEPSTAPEENGTQEPAAV